jgi:MATE family multidrug resistance protein
MLKSQYYKDNLKLAYPIILSSLGQSIVQFFDTLMVGHLGKESLAAVAFSAAITTVALVFGQGIGMSLTPLVGQSFARKETKRISMLLQNAISLNFFTGLFIIAVLMMFVSLMPHL